MIGQTQNALQFSPTLPLLCALLPRKLAVLGFSSVSIEVPHLTSFVLGDMELYAS